MFALFTKLTAMFLGPRERKEMRIFLWFSVFRIRLHLQIKFVKEIPSFISLELLSNLKGIKDQQHIDVSCIYSHIVSHVGRKEKCEPVHYNRNK